MRIEERPLSKLRFAPYNPRRMSDEAFAGLQASIERFGVVETIVVNDRTGHVVGGHYRVRAMRKRGDKTAHCVIVDLDENEEKALNVALNNPHIGGEYTSGLQDILAELKQLGDDSLFEDLRLDELQTDLGLPDADGEGDDDEKDDEPERFEVVVRCDNEGMMRDLAERLREDGYSVTTVTL